MGSLELIILGLTFVLISWALVFFFLHKRNVPIFHLALTAMILAILAPLPRVVCFDGCTWYLLPLIFPPAIFGILFILPAIVPLVLYTSVFLISLLILRLLPFTTRGRTSWIYTIIFSSIILTILLNISIYLLSPSFYREIQMNTQALLSSLTQL